MLLASFYMLGFYDLNLPHLVKFYIPADYHKIKNKVILKFQKKGFQAAQIPNVNVMPYC
jgi:hypothetical protein